MSKINQIQSKLNEINGAVFQKLSDHYLRRKGYEYINPVGSVIGKDKVRKGTPDTLIKLPNGKFIFAEYTTQKTNIIDKISKDLDKCLDENKTGISNVQIDEIIVCHTSILNASDENFLSNKCLIHGINLNIFGLGRISYDLYERYPDLAKEYLNIEINTGQIVPVSSFIELYNNNKVTTSLNTKFKFREDEKRDVLEQLNKSNLIVISGNAGIGKTRFALKIVDEYLSNNPEYVAYGIFNRGQDLFEDIRIYFADEGKYLILLDDVNRLSHIEYFVHLINEQSKNQEIKIIATVRDYAQSTFISEIASVKKIFKLNLSRLENSEIKEILTDEYNINHPTFIKRILLISKGNPRLAIMSAEVVKEYKNLDSITDASSLYEKYFGSIKRDLEEFNNENIIKFAGIISFFQVLDLSKHETTDKLNKLFGISKETIWQASKYLHHQELIDIYEDEIIKISDQVLSSYLFYQTFFIQKKLDFSIIINELFLDYKDKITDALNPVINIFDSNKIFKVLRPIIDAAWESYIREKDQNKLLQLMETFWYLKRTDILIYIQKEIKNLEKENIDFCSITKEPVNRLNSPSILSILERFKNSDQADFEIALDLIIKFISKCPSELPSILYIITKAFNYHTESHIDQYIIQKTIISKLRKQIEIDKNQLFLVLFLKTSQLYLRTIVSTTESIDRRNLNIIQFNLPVSEELFELRHMIFEGISYLYNSCNFIDQVLDLLYDYSSTPPSSSKILEEDSKFILEFIDLSITPNNYKNCLVVQKYLTLLSKKGLQHGNLLQSSYNNRAYKLSHILIFDLSEEIQLNLTQQEYVKLKDNQITEHFKYFKYKNYVSFFKDCDEIFKERHLRGENEFHFPSRIEKVLVNLASQDKNILHKVLDYYFDQENIIHIDGIYLMKELINRSGVDHTYKYLANLIPCIRNRWLFNFYRHCPG